MAEPPRRMRRSAANAAERILTLLLAISCPSPRHAAAPRQAHAAQPWAVYLVLRVRGGAARASEDARGVRLTRPDPCAFGTIRDTFGPTTVDDSSDDASRPTAERRVHALDSDRERKELRRRPGESKDGGASPARSGTAVPVRGRPQRWHSVPGRWWRQAQRAARRVMFEARNVVSGGAHALYWKRLVRSEPPSAPAPARPYTRRCPWDTVLSALLAPPSRILAGLDRRCQRRAGEAPRRALSGSAHVVPLAGNRSTSTTPRYGVREDAIALGKARAKKQ